MLSILCVTKAENHTPTFLLRMAQAASILHGECVFAADGAEAFARLRGMTDVVVKPVNSKGYLENVLEEAVRACSGDYILRIDDDEALSPCLMAWLVDGGYKAHDHWKFARAHVWPGDSLCILNPPLWPDHQTGLSVKAKSGGRHTVHAGSPFGGGRLAPAVLEHHKFVVKTVAERREIAARYDAYHPGYGTGGFTPFNMPEEVWTPEQRDIRTLHYADWLAQDDANKQTAA